MISRNGCKDEFGFEDEDEDLFCTLTTTTTTTTVDYCRTVNYAYSFLSFWGDNVGVTLVGVQIIGLIPR